MARPEKSGQGTAETLFAREIPQNQQPLQLENSRLLRGSALNKPSACPQSFGGP